MNLDQVFEQYGHPDPATVSILDKNGVQLSYVGHAEITRALSEIDPNWTWEPVLGADGLPAIRIQHGQIPRRDREPILVDMATMWGRLTLCGVTRWAVGSVEAHKPDLDKELVSDFLRNAAMRFGVALSLWMKDTGNAPRPAMVTRQQGSITVTQPANQISDKQANMIRALCKSAGRTVPANLGAMTKSQASGFIDRLKAGEEPQTETPADDIEEPF